MKKLLMLGGGFLQKYVIRKAKTMGYYVLCLDADPNAVGFAIADEHAVINIVDEEACLAYARDKQVDGVLTAATDFSVLTMSRIAEELHLPGINYQSAKVIKNKALVRKRLLDDLLFLEHESDTSNIFRRLLDIPKSNIKVLKPLCFVLARYCNPTLRISEPFIFHSSYFRYCRNKYARNVTTVHDFTYEYFYKHKRRGWFLHVWQRNHAIRRSDAVVCISENTKKDLLKFVKGVNPDKVYVIPNGVSSDYIPIKDEEKIPELKDWLLYVGGRTSYKNCYKFIDFIKDTDYKVVFCGSKLTGEEVVLFNNQLGKDRYKVYTNISNCELNRKYNSVMCLVYPSSYEGFGIPVLEAQKAGCPVIALNASSIPEVLGESPLLMEELTKENLLSKLEMLKNTSLRGYVINNGFINSSKYSWDNIYISYRELYKRLLL